MKKLLGLALLAAATALPTLAHECRADVYVVQIGDTGGGALGTASFATFVKKYSDAGSLLSTINMPTAVAGDNQQLTMSGTTSSMGFIKASTNGQYLTLAGYATGVGTATVSDSLSTAVPRVVGRIKVSDLTVDTTTVFNADSSYSGDAIRSVISDDGNNLWISGTAAAGNGGSRYATLGTHATTQLSAAPSNTRVIDIFNGQLYTSSTSVTGGAFVGVNTVGTGLPTTTGQTTTQLTGFPASATGHSFYDFWFSDANTVYVADDGSAAQGGGIQKWTQSAGTWSLAYTLLNNGTTRTATRGLTGKIDGANVVLFATTANTNSANQLITVTDTGAAATATTLATADANTVFRGVDFIGLGAVGVGFDADFDNQDPVEGNDFLIWQKGLGLTGQPNKSTGDSDGNGTVDATDLANWQAHYGLNSATAAVGAVPEPASAAMGLVALLGLAGLRRKR